jgi:hypothetical protein
VYYIYIVRWAGKEKTYALESDAKTKARTMRDLGEDVRLFRRQVSAAEYSRIVLKNVVYGASYTPPPRPYVPWNTPERGSL